MDVRGCYFIGVCLVMCACVFIGLLTYYFNHLGWILDCSFFSLGFDAKIQNSIDKPMVSMSSAQNFPFSPVNSVLNL